MVAVSCGLISEFVTVNNGSRIVSISPLFLKVSEKGRERLINVIATRAESQGGPEW